MIALWFLVSRTQDGKRMRATSFDLEAAAMMGVNIDKVIVFTFFLGSALAGAAGVMFGLVSQNVSPYIGFVAGLKASPQPSSAASGTSPARCSAGSCSAWPVVHRGVHLVDVPDLIVFTILIVFMLFRPTGLLGTAAIRKV